MDLPTEYEPLLVSLICGKLGVTISPEQVIAMQEDSILGDEIIYDDILDADYLT